MKRMIPLLLVILMLTACTAQPSVTPTAAPTPEATPAQTESPTPSPTPESNAVPVEFALPDPGFEADSWWLADAYGDEGKALMLTATDEDGVMQLKCWYDFHAEVRSGGRTERDLMCGSFSAADYSGGSFEISGTVAGNASVSVDGDSLTVAYTGLEEGTEMPAGFKRVTEDAALEVFRDMPYNDETELPIPPTMTAEEFEALPGLEQTGEETYLYNGMEITPGATSFSGDITLWSVRATDPENIPDIRGVKIGSAVSDVLECFPGEAVEIADLTGEVQLYGTDGIESCRGMLAVSEDGSLTLSFTDMYSNVSFEFDTDGYVEAISWSQAVKSLELP